MAVFLPGESLGWGKLVGCRLRGRRESNVTEATQQQQQQHISYCILLTCLCVFLPPMLPSPPGSSTHLGFFKNMGLNKYLLNALKESFYNSV